MRGCVIAVGFQQRGPWLLCLLYHTGGWGGGGGLNVQNTWQVALLFRSTCIPIHVLSTQSCGLYYIYIFFYTKFAVTTHEDKRNCILFCTSVSSTCKVSLRRLVGIFSETAFFQDYEITAILMVSLPAYAVPSCQAKVLVGLVPSPCLAFHILPPSSCPLPVTSLLQHPPPHPPFPFYSFPMVPTFSPTTPSSCLWPLIPHPSPVLYGPSFPCLFFFFLFLLPGQI